MKVWIAPPTLPLVPALALTLCASASAQDLVAENERVAELACELGQLCGENYLEEQEREKEAIEGVVPRGFPSIGALKAAARAKPAVVGDLVRSKEPIRLKRTGKSAPGGIGDSIDRGSAAVPAALAARAPLFLTFPLNSARLTQESAQEIRDFAKALELIALSGQAKRFRIEGHADATGDESFNRTLSEERAGAVRMGLIAAGIDPALIEIAGYGSERPVEGYDKTSPINRRVEAVEIK
jgi:outer membrane protein OmpA-like peptidoglycan-associated protein